MATTVNVSLTRTDAPGAIRRINTAMAKAEVSKETVSREGVEALLKHWEFPFPLTDFSVLDGDAVSAPPSRSSAPTARSLS